MAEIFGPKPVPIQWARAVVASAQGILLFEPIMAENAPKQGCAPRAQGVPIRAPGNSPRACPCPCPYRGGTGHTPWAHPRDAARNRTDGHGWTHGHAGATDTAPDRGALEAVGAARSGTIRGALGSRPGPFLP
jgi:hypothetical protein